MSWNASVPTTPAAEFAAAVDACAISPAEDGLNAEVKEQVTAAREAVKAIVASGALGDESKSYQASFSGHANSEHEPDEGWANDCIQISLSQATAS